LSHPFILELYGHDWNIIPASPLMRDYVYPYMNILVACGYKHTVCTNRNPRNMGERRKRLNGSHNTTNGKTVKKR
jgi:hypothetical protein